MNMKLLATSAAAALLLAVPAFAATVTIDTFTTEQVAGDTPRFGVTSPSTALGGAGSGFIGDSRTFTVTNTQVGNDPRLATVLESINGAVAFNNDSGARGTATLTYDGLFDLMASFSTGQFFFDVISFDQVADFMLSGRDINGNTISYSELISPTFNPTLRFTEITGASTFDFSNVASLSFTIDSSNTVDSVDGRLASIEVSAVPVPAAGLLLLGALGGAAALRRRKAKKAA